MKSSLANILLWIVIVLIQVSVVVSMRIGLVVPDLVAIALALGVAKELPEQFLVSGVIVGGIMLDIFSQTRFGVHSLVLLVVLGSGILLKKMYFESAHPLTIFISVGLTSFVYAILLAVLIGLFSWKYSVIALASALYAAIIGVAVASFLHKTRESFFSRPYAKLQTRHTR